MKGEKKEANLNSRPMKESHFRINFQLLMVLFLCLVLLITLVHSPHMAKRSISHKRSFLLAYKLFFKWLRKNGVESHTQRPKENFLNSKKKMPIQKREKNKKKKSERFERRCISGWIMKNG